MNINALACVVVLFCGSQCFGQMTFNDILNDPKLLRDNKDVVIAGWKKYYPVGNDAHFYEMKKKHTQLCENLAASMKRLTMHWSAAASFTLGEDQTAKALEAASGTFEQNCKLLGWNPENRYIGELKTSANEYYKLWKQLKDHLNKHVNAGNKVNVGMLDSAQIEFTKSVDALVFYWDSSFKDVADAKQVLDMIRTAVYALKNGDYRSRQQALDRSKDELLNLQKRYNGQLAEWAKGWSGDLNAKIPAGLQEMRTKIIDLGAKIEQQQKELASFSQDVDRFIKEFGLNE
jgi:methyl-accepting chemotaxis protein